MMVWLVGKCGCHDRSFSGILGPRLFLSPDNIMCVQVDCEKQLDFPLKAMSKSI